MALATLTKGPVGPAIVAASGVASWWWGGPTACWRRLRWRWGIGDLPALTLPWFVAIGVASKGEFFRFAVGTQVVGRVASGIEQHTGFPGYYLVTSIVTFYPWSALLPAALAGGLDAAEGEPRAGLPAGVGRRPVVPAGDASRRSSSTTTCPPIRPAPCWRPGWSGRWPRTGRGRCADGRSARLGLGHARRAWGSGLTAVLLAAGFACRASSRPAVADPGDRRDDRRRDALRAGAGSTRGRPVGRCAGAWWRRGGGHAPGRRLAPAVGEALPVLGAVGRTLAEVSAREGATADDGNFQPPGVIYALGRPRR